MNRSADRIRGGLSGVTCGVLAVTAHGWAGELPGSAALTVLLAVGCAVGAGTATVVGRSRFGLFTASAAGQFAAHMLLSASAGRSDMPMSEPGESGWLMLAAHALATLICVVLTVAADRWYRALSSTVRTLVRPFEPHRVHGELRIVRTRAVVRRIAEHLLGAISRRGPPVSNPAAFAL
ncbi:hypothetical protein EBN03_25335 [Nocardia stercoris]|uniref:Uncharacterized protein n=2 Tax=Nocardia stercoris TaxID=2483361 RepID=A0A3M2KVU5_9NOCA|nr:hypothetical protein EBN03_25335 [Nocardia stercoris]